MPTPTVPVLVQPGWTRAVRCGPVRALFYEDGKVRIEHLCKRPMITVVCAPALRLDGGHRIVREDPLTVMPSILCPDCGLHGFITEGRWT